MPSASGAKKPKGMNKKHLQHFEKRLLEERRRVLKELGHYDETFGSTPQSADGDLSSYSFHMADQGTDAMEREKAFLFASQEGRFLWHIDEALRRLYRSPETFGSTPQSADGDLSSYSFHMADQGTDAMEREKAFLFASQEGRFLWHIDEALRRLYRSPETFGKCHNCGQEIAYERLDALPHARYCIECKQREEDAKK